MELEDTLVIHLGERVVLSRALVEHLELPVVRIELSNSVSFGTWMALLPCEALMVSQVVSPLELMISSLKLAQGVEPDA